MAHQGRLRRGNQGVADVHEIGDQVETVEVLFDPEVVSYEELLALFWKSHDPTARPYARQYASLVLVSDDEQLADGAGECEAVRA